MINSGLSQDLVLQSQQLAERSQPYPSPCPRCDLDYDPEPAPRNLFGLRQRDRSRSGSRPGLGRGPRPGKRLLLPGLNELLRFLDIYVAGDQRRTQFFFKCLQFLNRTLELNC